MDLAWIHLENLKFFLYLGVTEAEQLIGQNITMHLSLQMPYQNTNDDMNNSTDYGEVFENVRIKIHSFKRVQLLEYLAEQILEDIHHKYPKIYAAKIILEKGYVPLKNFSGTVRIVILRKF